VTAPLEGLDWLDLTVESGGRRVIFSERFPAMMAAVLDATSDPQRARQAFTQDYAKGLLGSFAGQWPTLRPTRARQRWLYLALPNDPTMVAVFAFYGVELEPGMIVVEVDHQASK